MTAFAKHAFLLFLALRAGDIINLIGGVWFVPKYLSPDKLGAVLPTVSYATLIAIPVFAWAMTVMKESVDLTTQKSYAKRKTLLMGTFIGGGLLALIVTAITILTLPQFADKIQLKDMLAYGFIIGSSFLGTFAPIYTDALQAEKRFGALGLIEIIASLFRLITMMIVMPLRALLGYFMGGFIQQLLKILGAITALRQSLTIIGEPYWTLNTAKHLLKRFFLLLIYLALPMWIALVEQMLIRTTLSSEVSAGYYIVTRLTDILNYLTLPILLVLFPYAAETELSHTSALTFVTKSVTVTLLAAAGLMLVYLYWGTDLIQLIPNGKNYLGFIRYAPHLLAITALTAAQTFYTNAQVATSRYQFFWWFLPLNLIYYAVLKYALIPGAKDAISLNLIINYFLIMASLRFIAALLSALFDFRQETRMQK